MKYILSILLVSTLSPWKVCAQTESSIKVHLFEDLQQSATFDYSFEMDAEGENAIGKTVFQNRLVITTIKVIQDTFTLQMVADSTTISNPEAVDDGEVALLYAMMGVKMLIKCDAQGKLIEVLNKEEVITAFKKGMTNRSEKRKDQIVQNMLQQDEALFFRKIYDVNYAPLISNLKTEVSLPIESPKDSTTQATTKSPETTTVIQKKHQQTSTGHNLTQTILQNSKEFIKMENGYELSIQPFQINNEKIVKTLLNGYVQEVATDNTIKRGAIIMSKDKVVVSRTEPFTEFSKWRYVRVE